MKKIKRLTTPFYLVECDVCHYGPKNKRTVLFNTQFKGKTKKELQKEIFDFERLFKNGDKRKIEYSIVYEINTVCRTVNGLPD